MIAELFVSIGNDDMDSLEDHNVRTIEQATKLLREHTVADMLMLFDIKNEDVVGTWSKKSDGTIVRLN